MSTVGTGSHSWFTYIYKYCTISYGVPTTTDWSLDQHQRGLRNPGCHRASKTLSVFHATKFPIESYCNSPM